MGHFSFLCGFVAKGLLGFRRFCFLFGKLNKRKQNRHQVAMSGFSGVAPYFADTISGEELDRHVIRGDHGLQSVEGEVNDGVVCKRKVHHDKLGR